MTVWGVTFLALIMPFAFFGADINEGPTGVAISIFISLIYTLIYWFGNRAIIIAFRKRYPGFNEVDQRLKRQIPAMVLYSLIVPNILCFIEYATDLRDITFTMWLREQSSSLFAVIAVGAIYEGVFFYRRLGTSLSEQERLKRENIQTQLDSLKSQVNPHFLFNSLNTLAQLIPEDQEQAVQFVQKLSRSYRYILEINDRETISLREEMDFIKSYLFLVKTRFGNNLDMRINIPEDFLDVRIVPLTIQLLLENAIKHNIVSTEKPLLVDLFIDNNHLVMKNAYQPKSQPVSSTGVGLRNIRNRYRYLTNMPVEVVHSQTHFTVAVPLLKIAKSA
jgi:LytS/YehU family sensor histidine kinase